MDLWVKRTMWRHVCAFSTPRSLLIFSNKKPKQHFTFFKNTLKEWGKNSWKVAEKQLNPQLKMNENHWKLMVHIWKTTEKACNTHANASEQFFLGGSGSVTSETVHFQRRKWNSSPPLLAENNPFSNREMWLKFTYFRHRLAPFSYEQFFGGVQDLDKWNGAFSKEEVNLKSTTTRRKHLLTYLLTHTYSYILIHIYLYIHIRFP